MFTATSPPRFSTLVLLTAVSTLSLNMFLPALAHIARDMAVDYDVASLALGGYLAVTALVQMIAGPLSDRIGRRPVLLGALILFTIASLICAQAEDIRTFLIFRMLQGAIITGYALSMAIIRDTVPERQAAGLIGYISMAMALAPMIGPVMGGVLDASLGWRAIFYAYAVAGLVMLGLVWADLGETRPRVQPSLRATSETGLHREPLFWAYSLGSALSVGAFYTFLIGAPLVAADQFGVSSAALGFYIGSITGGFMLGSFLAGRYAPRIAPVTMMLSGRLVAVFGLGLGLAITLAGHATPLLFFGCTIFVGLGNGLTVPSCNAAAMSVRPEQAGRAAGWNGALIVTMGAVLIARLLSR
jgi:Bcr/CflA subfamily drug resistance transporter